jgi:hypothetical protein
MVYLAVFLKYLLTNDFAYSFQKFAHGSSLKRFDVYLEEEMGRKQLKDSK